MLEKGINPNLHVGIKEPSSGRSHSAKSAKEKFCSEGAWHMAYAPVHAACCNYLGNVRNLALEPITSDILGWVPGR